jgi:O-antigen/teichoic acid export membrane protein
MASFIAKLDCAEDARLGAGLSFVLAMVQLLVKAASSVLVVRISLRYLGTREYGAWIIVQTISAYLLLADFGLGQTVVNRVGAAFAKARYRQIGSILSNAFALYCILAGCAIGLAAVSVLLPIDRFLLGITDMRFRWYLLDFSILALLRLPPSVFSAALSGMRDLPARQVFELSSPIFILMATAIVLGAGGGLPALINVTGAGLAAISLLGCLVLRSRHREGWNLSWRLVRRRRMGSLYGNSIGFFCISIAILVQRSVPNILAARVLGLELVPSIFAIQLVLRSFALPVVDSLSRGVQPYLIRWHVEGQHEKVRLVTALSVKLSVLCGYSILCGLYLFGEPIWHLWLGSQPYPGRLVTMLLGASFLFDTWLLSATNYLIAINRHWGIALLNAIFAGLQVAFAILGSRLWKGNPAAGMCAGIAAASLVCQLFGMGLLAAKVFSFRPRHFAANLLLRPVLALLAGGLLVIALDSSTRLLPAHMVWQTILGTLTLVSASAIVLGRAEIRWLLAILQHQVSRI